MPDKPAVLDKLAQKNYLIQEVDFDTMLGIVQSCQYLDKGQRNPKGVQQHQDYHPSDQSINMWTMLKGIVPGTKWCGFNDVAVNYNDLGQGSFFEVDKCCRAHDHCPIKVHGFSSSYGATNYHPYTKYVVK